MKYRKHVHERLHLYLISSNQLCWQPGLDQLQNDSPSWQLCRYSAHNQLQNFWSNENAWKYILNLFL